MPAKKRPITVKRSRKKVLRIPKAKRTNTRSRKITRLFVRTTLMVVSLVVIWWGIRWWVSQPAMRIETIDVVGVQTIDPELVRDTARALLSEYSVIGLPRDSWLWYSRTAIEDSLYGAFPQIRQVTVGGFSTIKIEIEENQSQYQYCREQECYRINNSGLVFDKTAMDESTVRFSHKEKSRALRIPSQVISAPLFKRLQETVERLAAIGLEIDQVVLHDDLLVSLELQSGTRIISRPNYTADYVATVVRSIMGISEFGYKSDDGRFRETLRYINIRYDSRILYCDSQECENNY